MKKKVMVSKNLIKICICLLIIISLMFYFVSMLESRLPVEFRNLPEGETIDRSLYEYVGKDWILTGVPNRKAKGSSSIYLYDNDTSAIFFANQPKYDDRSATTYYHRKDDILPKPYDETAKYVITLTNHEIGDRSSITFKDDLADEFRLFIEKCIVDSKNIIELDKLPNMAWIDIYHKDYPAYNSFASFGIVSGKLVMDTQNNFENHIYYELPDDLSDKIKELIL